MNPLVSILIPAYNTEKYLAATLESVLAQTWSNLEIIVVDDGSRDDTLNVARTFTSGQVKVIAQENRGQSASENRAFAECQGGLIEYLDADDLLSPDKIETQLRRLKEEPEAVATCRWGRFVDTPADAWFVPEPFWRDMDPVDWLVDCWSRCGMMHGATWLVPRAVAERAGPWDESLSLINDFDFFCRILLASRQVVFCPETVTYYRSNLATSLSGAKSPAAWDSAFRSVKAGTTRLLAVEDSPRTRRAAAISFQNLVYSAYPDVPELREEAERAVRSLGGCDLSCPGGTKFLLASRLVGWQAAKKIQRIASRMKTGR